MARLIVLDASAGIAAFAVDEAHHAAAAAALASADEDEFVLAATTRAEILVGPSRAGGTRLLRARDFVDGCATCRSLSRSPTPPQGAGRSAGRSIAR